MAAKKPTHAQAGLQLQLYELRREAKLRQAREWFLTKYFPATPEDHQRLTPHGSQEETYLRMVLSYWEEACAMLNAGLLHEELFFKTTNEFFFVWERIKDLVPGMRQTMRNPHHFAELESAARRYQRWAERRAPGYLDVLRQWMQQVRSAGLKQQ